MSKRKFGASPAESAATREGKLKTTAHRRAVGRASRKSILQHRRHVRHVTSCFFSATPKPVPIVEAGGFVTANRQAASRVVREIEAASATDSASSTQPITRSKLCAIVTARKTNTERAANAAPSMRVPKTLKTLVHPRNKRSKGKSHALVHPRNIRNKGKSHSPFAPPAA